MLSFLRIMPGLFILLAVGLPAREALADLSRAENPPHLVVEVTTGTVYSQHRAFTRWAPASLTKMMTAYTVFRGLKLQHIAMNSPVRISEEAAIQPPSKMGFPVGTVLTIETALKIIMVKSANDIAVALAEAAAGSEQEFVQLMNSHARRLGMLDTRFANPHGLHDPQQYTSARDMAMLTRAITREFPQYAGFFDIPAIRVTGRRLRNHNALLRLFDGTNGMKTGYVCASGYNVVVRVKRGDKKLIAVVFGGKSGLERNVRAAQLLSDAFSAKVSDNSPTLVEMTKPATVSSTPVDITRTTCPNKYAAEAKPVTRPQDAPSSQDFDGIDTQVIETRRRRARNPLHTIPVPVKSPQRPKPAEASESVKLVEAKKTPRTDGSDNEPVPEDTPPTLADLADVYFQPRADLRKDVVLRLGGGVGPNPFGIKHTDGGVYKAPIPVPIKRPALDLDQSPE